MYSPDIICCLRFCETSLEILSDALIISIGMQILWLLSKLLPNNGLGSVAVTPLLPAIRTPKFAAGSAMEW
jgi:hypothetical protein